MRHQVTISEDMWKELEEIGMRVERTAPNVARWFIRKQLKYEKKAGLSKETGGNQVIQSTKEDDKGQSNENNLAEVVEIINTPWAN